MKTIINFISRHSTRFAMIAGIIAAEAVRAGYITTGQLFRGIAVTVIVWLVGFTIVNLILPLAHLYLFHFIEYEVSSGMLARKLKILFEALYVAAMWECKMTYFILKQRWALYKIGKMVNEADAKKMDGRVRAFGRQQLTVTTKIHETMLSMRNSMRARSALQIKFAYMQNLDLGSLAKYEQSLRQSNSRVYLIAVPLEWYGGQFRSILPGKPITEYNRALWVCMNGKQEAEEKLAEHGLTEAENIHYLDECGFLSTKES